MSDDRSPPPGAVDTPASPLVDNNINNDAWNGGNDQPANTSPGNDPNEAPPAGDGSDVPQGEGLELGDGAKAGTDLEDGRRGPPNIEGLISLKVDELDFRVQKDELRAIFDGFGDIGDVHIPRGRTGQSRGFGFVRFKSRADADKALEAMDGKDIAGRKVKVSLAERPRPTGVFEAANRPPRRRTPSVLQTGTH